MERIFSRSSLVRIGWGTSRRFWRERALVRSKQVGARADERHQAHHQFLADRVDRRIGDLGEVLLEIGVKQLRLDDSAEIGVSVPIEPMASWPVWPSAPSGTWVFLGVAEGLLAVEQRHVLRAAGLASTGLRSFQDDLGAVQPLAVGMLGGELAT
jgi:hypothetical protein